MTQSAPSLRELLLFACGQPVDTGTGEARRWQLVLGALFVGLALSAIWGAAAGSATPALALGNVFKVPLVLLLSGLAALPAGLLALKLSALGYRGRDLVASFASSVLAATLALAVLAPLVALYYHTSALVGSHLATGSVFAAVAVGMLVLGRNLLGMVPPGMKRRAALLPAVVLVVMHLAALTQLVALASPILADPTPFSGGIDELLVH